MEDEPFFDFAPKVFVVKSLDRGNSYRFDDLSGEEQMATFALNQIYIDGKRPPPNGQLSLDELRDRARMGEIVRAEVVQKTANSTSEPNFSKWNTISIFIGSREPPAHTAIVPNFNLIPHDQSIRMNERVVAMETDPTVVKFGLGVAKTESGEKVIINKNVFFDAGRPTKNRDTESTEIFFEPGKMIHVDLAKVPNYYHQRFPIFRDYQFITTLAWQGEKPDLSKIRQYSRLIDQSRPGNVTFLLNDETGVSIGGIIHPYKFENKPDTLPTNVRVWFDRKDAYLFGTCMENTNLALFFSNYSRVDVYFESDPVPRHILAKIQQIFGRDDRFTYVQAKFVTRGPVKPEDLLFENRENRFRVNLANMELMNYLRSNHNLTCSDFQFLVNPIGSRESGVQRLLPAVANESGLKGRIVTLKKPAAGKVTGEGYLEILSEKYKTQWIVVNRWSIWIFGHCLESANLMDFILPSDIFNVEMETSSVRGLIVKSAWIGPMPTPSVKNSPPDPENFPEFWPWMRKHGYQSRMEFFNFLRGDQTQLTPFFPILPAEMIDRQTANVLAIHRLPAGFDVTTFGLLTISTGPMKGEIVPFRADDVYVMDYNIGFCDNLSLIFDEGDEVFCEVRKSQHHEVVKWNALFGVTCNKDGSRFKINPRHMAVLVYRGHRPNQPRPKPVQRLLAEILDNDRLLRWLGDKRLRAEDLVRFISGEGASRPTDFQSRNLEPIPSTSRGAAPVPRMTQPPPVGQVKTLMTVPPPPILRQARPPPVHQPPPRQAAVAETKSGVDTDAFMKKAVNITHRAMNCFSLTDPKINDIITNDEDEELTVFLAKALTAATELYAKKKEKAKKILMEQRQPRPMDISPPPEPLSNYFENLSRSDAPTEGVGSFGELQHSVSPMRRAPSFDRMPSPSRRALSPIRTDSVRPPPEMRMAGENDLKNRISGRNSEPYPGRTIMTEPPLSIASMPPPKLDRPPPGFPPVSGDGRLSPVPVPRHEQPRLPPPPRGAMDGSRTAFERDRFESPFFDRDRFANGQNDDGREATNFPGPNRAPNNDRFEDAFNENRQPRGPSFDRSRLGVTNDGGPRQGLPEPFGEPVPIDLGPPMMTAPPVQDLRQKLSRKPGAISGPPPSMAPPSLSRPVFHVGDKRRFENVGSAGPQQNFPPLKIQRF